MKKAWKKHGKSPGPTRRCFESAAVASSSETDPSQLPPEPRQYSSLRFQRRALSSCLSVSPPSGQYTDFPCSNALSRAHCTDASGTQLKLPQIASNCHPLPASGRTAGRVWPQSWPEASCLKSSKLCATPHWQSLSAGTVSRRPLAWHASTHPRRQEAQYDSRSTRHTSTSWSSDVMSLIYLLISSLPPKFVRDEVGHPG